MAKNSQLKSQESEFVLIKNKMEQGQPLAFSIVESPNELKTIVLYNGWNDVKRSYVEELKKNKIFSSRKDAGFIEISEGGLFDIKEFDRRKTIINETFDIRQLKVWETMSTDNEVDAKTCLEIEKRKKFFKDELEKRIKNQND